MNESLHEKICTFVNNEPGIAMATLLQWVEGATNGDIFALIASRKLYLGLKLHFRENRKKYTYFAVGRLQLLLSHFGEGCPES